MARGDDPTVWEVDDALWAELRPLLAVDKPRKKPGAPRKGDRGLFNGLLRLARTGGRWAAIPRRYGAKSTIHDRFRRLLVRWEKQGANYLGFVQLAALLIVYRKLRRARRPVMSSRVGPQAMARDEGTGASAFATRSLAIAALIVAGAFWAPGSSGSCAA